MMLKCFVRTNSRFGGLLVEFYRSHIGIAAPPSTEEQGIYHAVLTIPNSVVTERLSEYEVGTTLHYAAMVAAAWSNILLE
jgi:hypothetical protein